MTTQTIPPTPDRTFEDWQERFHYLWDKEFPAPTYNTYVGRGEYYNTLTDDEAIIFCLLIQESRK